MQLNVNGVEREVESPLLAPLLVVLREELGITSPKAGCQQGGCGACTVLVDGKTARSCLMLAVQADGADVRTVEGLAAPDGSLHPLQQAFWDNHGLQCGFCTPGMLMSALELLQQNPSPTELEVREAIAGNICRCTGYVFIVKSILAAAETMRAGAPTTAGAAR